MAAGQQFAADRGKRLETVAFHIFNGDAALVIIQLADQKVTPREVRPAEKRVGLQLHGALAFDRALSVVMGGFGVGQIGRIAGRSLLLDLQEERIPGAIAFKVDAVVAGADRASADHLECHIDRAVEREPVLPLRLQHRPVGSQRAQHGLGLAARDPGKRRLDFFEAARRARL